MTVSDVFPQTPPNVPQDRMDVSPIIYGTSAFAQLYNPIKAHWPAEACKRAIDLGINTFDTSPYYGNSEQVLGKALLSISATHPRSTYYLSTKVGRYGLKKKEFNYSKERVRASVEESMDRMHTNYLDIVYAHDVEFVSVDEAVEAVGELFRLKAEGKIKYVGISDYIAHFRDLGISTIWSASPVSMGLLRSNIPVPEWHPAPAPLLSAAQDCIKIVEDQSPGKDLAEIAVKFAMKWRGCEGLVVGMSNAEEVEKNVAWWKDVQEDGARDEVQERCEAALRRRLQAFEKLEWASPPIDDC
ncbi:hypothetical protein BGZ54_009068 [Gamsiella multidivaricata]|nr:hypothetical protein BGZ54_009068 [Gamsiella multidivaricata]